MNRIYKSKWNKSTGQCVAVSELTKGRVKNKKGLSSVTSKLLPATFMFLGTSAAYAITSCPVGVTCTGTADFITENRGGVLQVEDLTMTQGGTGPGANFAFIQLGHPGGGGAEPKLVANRLDFNVNTASHMDRAILVASNLAGTNLTTEITDSNIVFNSSGSTASNTLALLSEGYSSGQSHHITIQSSNLSSISRDAHSFGILAYSGGGAENINISLQGQNHISSTTQSSTAKAMGIQVGVVKNFNFIEDSSGGSITAKANSGDAHGIISDDADINIVETHSDITATSTAGNVTGINLSASTANQVTTHAGEIKALTNTGVGIGISALGAGNQTVQNSANITVTGSNTQSAGIKAVSSGSNAYVDIFSVGDIHTSQFGIQAQSVNGGIDIVNYGNIISTGNVGISAVQTGTAAVGDIALTNTGDITTAGNSAYGMYASAAANAILLNEGSITTTGDYANGIRATNSGVGHIAITNNGAIATYGQNGHGILVETTVPSLQTTILNNGSIKLYGDYARGIIVQPFAGSNIKIINNGSITHSSKGDGKYGIDAKALDNSLIEIEHNGIIQGGDFGIVAWSGFASQTGGQVTINVNSGAKIQDVVYGISADMSQRNTINIAQGASVDAQKTSIYFREYNTEGQTNTLNNEGTITSDADIAIQGRALAANSTLDINNAGFITGYFILQDETTAVNNAGVWNLRNFADTTGNRVRDTKSVAISDFGGGVNTVNNTGTLSLAAVTGETSTVATGQYTPVGALDITNAGIVHGQLLNLSQFENSGLIDLSASGQAGNVLVITGGGTAGSNGAGQYTSNGGALRLNTVMNQGDTASLSDILVLDNAVTGTGATRIYINNASGSTGGLTVGDGIKLVEVQGNSASDAFTLGSPVTYGAYEYVLGNGLTSTTANNWYLRNTLSSGAPLPNPNAGSYLSNQYIAGILFNQNILDRRANVREPDQTLWVRYNHSEIDSNLLNGTMSTDIRANIVQIGADIYKDEHQNGIVAGIYGGYGNANQNTHSKITGSKASGHVTGYQIGGYVSWMPEKVENKGPYADFWGHYAWYDNKLTGMTQGNKKASYDSTGYALSAEAGYSFELNKKADGSAWVLEPHAQIIYTSIDADNFYDNSKTYYSNNKAAGIQTRLGARLYGQREEGNKQVVSFIEANWLHNGVDNKIYLNNGTAVDTDIGKNVGELKLGVQGKLTERWSIWSHIGLQKGSNNYERTELQLGLGWQW